MRDLHGRYHEKPIEESAPTWAMGCSKCKFGIVDAPALTGVVELYLERLVQAVDGDVTFCTCKAGEERRKNVVKRDQFLRAEAKNIFTMQPQARRDSHVDIEVARTKMLLQREDTPAPTIHYERVAA
jgi:hypothetical protein